MITFGCEQVYGGFHRWLPEAQMRGASNHNPSLHCGTSAHIAHSPTYSLAAWQIF